MNKLYYDDNLQVLRAHVADQSVDLIYLDPPFNSKRDYNLLFKTPKGMESEASITAFEDTWHWGGQAQDEFREIEQHANTDVAEMMRALRGFLGENDMMAYLVMMCNRLLELHRVLKPTGSLYLHCDPTASHYLKIVLDGVFGKENYRNEIVWRRTTAKSQTYLRFPNNHDVLLFYGKTDKATFTRQFLPHSAERIKQHYSNVDADTGRLYSLDNLTAEGTRNGSSGDPWHGIDIRSKGNHWKYTIENLEALDAEGKIYWPSKPGSMPRFKRYLDEQEGVQIDTVWTDIPPINSQAHEALGYPTQKPLALLERIVQASSNAGDVVLDPFCGCGTAVHAAQKLGRRWIGIDITHLAVSLIEKRLKQAFPYLVGKSVRPEPVEGPGSIYGSTSSPRTEQQTSEGFEVIGVPQDCEAARDLALRDKHQFQLWACTLVGAQPYKGGKKGSDKGIDGLIFPEVAKGRAEKIVVSVKGGEFIGVSMVRDLKGVVEREKAAIGLFVTLTKPTRDMVKEAAAGSHYESPHHGAFAKIQILTIEGLLDGTERALFPDLAYGGQTFKKAKAETKSTLQDGLFD